MELLQYAGYDSEELLRPIYSIKQLAVQRSRWRSNNFNAVCSGLGRGSDESCRSSAARGEERVCVFRGDSIGKARHPNKM